MKETASLLQVLLAEFIGTFGLVYFGGLAAMQADSGQVGLLGVAVAHVLILSFLIYFARPISGAHFNTSVTLGFILTKKIGLSRGILYIFTQLLASLIAGSVLLLFSGNKLLKRNSGQIDLGYPHLAPGIPLINAIALETIGTFFLVFVIWAVAVDTRAPESIYGIAIGGTVGFIILAIGPLTGAALNPARVFGPALLIADYSNQWIYWVGPVIGGTLAAIFYNIIYLKD